MSQHELTYKPGSRLEHWMDERLPLMRMMHGQFVDFPTPRNLNYLWTFGGILTFCLVVQIVTGIVLAMHYIPNADMAFDSIEKIRRDVNYGWLIRNVHAVGSSMFFFAVYIHMARGLYYGSYKAPREMLWILGVLHLPPDDGDRLPRLHAAVGPDELLGRDRHHQPFLLARQRHPRARHQDRAVAVGRLLGVGGDAQPLLQPPLPAAVRDRRRRRAAYLGAARGRPEQPDGHRDQDQVGQRSRWRPMR